MPSKKLSIQNDFYDLTVIIKKIIDEKKIILTLCSMLMIIGFIYSSIERVPNYQSHLKIKKLPKLMLGDIDFKGHYSDFLNILLDHNHLSIFKSELSKFFRLEFINNLNSEIILEKYVAQNNEIAKYKTYLEKKGISPEKYFINNFKPKIENGRIVPNEFTLNFEGFLNGEKFIDDYVFFVKKQSELSLSRKVEKYFNLFIKITKDKLNKKKVFFSEDKLIKLDQLILNNKLIELEEQILNLGELKEKSKSFNYQIELDYNPFLKKTSTELFNSKHPIDYILLGLFSGLFFSFVIILFKNIIK